MIIRSLKYGLSALALLAGLPALPAAAQEAAAPPAPSGQTLVQSSGETDALKAAWALAPQGLDADIAKMESQWDAVEAQLADAQHIKIRAGKVSNWSVGQQCLHILKVANLIGSQVPGLLEGKSAEGGPAPSPMKAGVLAQGFPRGVAQAPAGLGVHYQPGLAEIQAELEKTRALWKSITDRRAEVASATASFPHPVLGPMSAAEWVRFTTVHTAHHLAIVDDILEDAAARAAQPAAP